MEEEEEEEKEEKGEVECNEMKKEEMILIRKNTILLKLHTI